MPGSFRNAGGWTSRARDRERDLYGVRALRDPARASPAARRARSSSSPRRLPPGCGTGCPTRMPASRQRGRRLEASIERCGAAGVVAHGALGDADPLEAMDDAIRTFSPDEVVVATHPEGESNWLEHGLVAQARARFGVPITHVVVDAVRSEAHVVAHEPTERDAPTREEHTSRDLALLAIVGVLAIVGSIISFVFFASRRLRRRDLGVGADLRPRVQDRGLVMLWMLFQRRARADRLDL